MKRVLYALVVAAVLLPSAAFANPTGAPLSSFPLAPCRFLDTRTTMGALPANTAMDVFIRGDDIPASQGALHANCGVPASAESVRITLTAVTPAAPGYLKVDGTGFAWTGTYSRMTYSAGQNTSSEMEISLCNIYLFPYAHQACAHFTDHTDPGNHIDLYADFQVINKGAGPVHLVGDVVGYLARP